MASITSATSGPSNVGSTWTGGVVPVLGDKPIIQHPGTNTPATAAQYQLNGARAAGDTSIPVDTGTGTIVAGECIQVWHQLGIDEDGQAIYDNTYYKVTTGITGAGTLVIASPGLTYAVADNTPIVNRGHVVELAADHTWGDDTSNSTTVGSNGIPVFGTLKASRSVSQTLTARGTVYIAGGGTLDYGDSGDEIPSVVVATMLVNDSATPAIGKHGLVSHNMTVPTWKIRGVKRTRNTRLTAATGAGATSITVDESIGWAIGDELVIASDTNDGARAQLTTITGGATPTWTVGAVAIARAAGCMVGNLSSNVRFKSASASFPGVFSFGSTSSSPYVLRAANYYVENIGNPAGWTGPSVNDPLYYGHGLVGARNSADMLAKRVAVKSTHALSGLYTSFSTSIIATARSGFVDSAAYSTGAGFAGYYVANSSVPYMLRNVVYRAAIYINMGFSAGPTNGVFEDCTGWCPTAGSLQAISAASGSLTVSGGSINAGTLVAQTSGNVALLGVSIDLSTALHQNGSNGQSKVVATNCTFAGAALTGNNTVGNITSQSSYSLLVAVNNVASDSRNINYHRVCITDLTTRKRGTYAVKIQPKVGNTAITYTFTLPGVAGVAQTIKGSLRFDSTYGTATPPRIDLSGQGVVQSFTAPAVADTWADFTLSFTPSSTGDITATVTVQSASTAGFAWLDGVWHYPMTQAVRHWGYQWLPQAAQLVDSRMTLTEAAALALPVAVDHTAQTVTVTGVVSPSEALQAQLVDLVQTANNARTVHCTGDGSTFATTYTVVLSGAGAITGSYTDADGLHVVATATLPASGCRVQLFDVTNGTELDNRVVSGTAYSLPLVYAGARTLRLRVAYQAGATAKLPAELFATLTSGGAAFVVPNVDDAVYIANGIDGATCTEFVPDYPNLQIDVSDPDGVTTVQRIYAWSCMANATATGIQLMFGAVAAADSLNYVIDVAKVNARFDNVSGAPVIIGGGYIRRSDGASVIAATSGSIQMDPGRAYLAPASIPSAATVASAVRSELATELAATLQARDLAEADVVFTPGGTPGTGTLAYHRRGTTTDLIPPKAVAGTSQTQASGATQ